MLLERLQSGFLLFETPQELMRVELSLRQRIHLLWTFRNFRQLSVPLLNLRERELVNTLFRNNPTIIPLDSYDPVQVIGVVERFVPPPMFTATAMPIDALLADKPIQKRSRKKKRRKEADGQHVEIALSTNLEPSSLPGASWSRLVTSKLAATVGALFLCIICVAAYRRIQGVPGSEASDQPRIEWVSAIAPPDSPDSARPAANAESAAPSLAPTTDTAQPVVASKAASDPTPEPTPGDAVKPAGLQIAAAAPPAIPTPKREKSVHDATAKPNSVSVQVTGRASDRISDQASSIEASRPPLRFVYPVVSNVRARGVVALTARVDSDGTVHTVKIVSGNHELAAAAVRAIRQWRYRPYLQDGQPVATATNIVISFISRDAISMSFPPSIPSTR